MAAAQGQANPGMTLTTTAFQDGGLIPTRFTGNAPSPVSPRLDWTHVPEGTASFTLILRDLDESPRKSTDDILHWMVFNIPGTARHLAEGMAAGVQPPDGTVLGKSHHGEHAYLPPGAPAAGPLHHYAFELYAVDRRLDLGRDAARSEVLAAINGHILAKAVIVGRFHL